MLFIANWKMFGSRQFIADWSRQFIPPACDVVVCPPFPYLSTAREFLPPTVSLGAQDVATQGDDGAHTGQVSARMLHDVGCTYALIGHSERRAMGETDSDCKHKIEAALAANIIPVLCIGETAEQHQQTEQILQQQIQPLIDALVNAQVTGESESESITKSASVTESKSARESESTRESKSTKTSNTPRAVLAYEPMWAIGSGKTPSVKELTAVQYTIRNMLNQKLNAQMGAFSGKISVLYGGSVSANNASLPHDAGLDGGLVGGASLDAVLFAQLCRDGDAL